MIAKKRNKSSFYVMRSMVRMIEFAEVKSHGIWTDVEEGWLNRSHRIYNKFYNFIMIRNLAKKVLR
jgi:hypothetical protein